MSDVAGNADIVDGLYFTPYTPRPRPTPIPEAAWNDEPTYCLRVNGEWVSHLLGLLVALDQPDTWEGTAEEIADARYQAVEMMTALMEQCEDETPVTDYIIGEIRAFAFTDLPDGWLMCDGSFVSRTTYADLFAVIGTGYGVGDGSTTFNLPNAAHRAPYGDGDGFPWSDLSLGQDIGAENHSLTVDELPSHNHTMRNHTGSGSQADISTVNNASTAQGNLSSLTTGNTGGGDPFSIQSPGFVVRFAIYAGV